MGKSSAKGTLEINAKYISLDGTQYTVEENKPESEFPFMRIVMGAVSGFIPVLLICAFYLELLEEDILSKTQIIVFFVALFVISVGLYLVIFGIPQVSTELFIKPTVETVSDSTNVLNADNMTEIDRKEFL